MAHASYYDHTLQGALLPVGNTSSKQPSTGVLGKLQTAFHMWRLRIETKRQLRKLPDYLLQDIGVTRYEVENMKFHF